MITIKYTPNLRLYDRLMLLWNNPYGSNDETILTIKEIFSIIGGVGFIERVYFPLAGSLKHNVELGGIKLCGLCRYCNSGCTGHHRNINNRILQGCWCGADERQFEFDPDNAIKEALLKKSSLIDNKTMPQMFQ